MTRRLFSSSWSQVILSVWASLSVTYIYGILLNDNDVGHSGQLWVHLWCINLFWYLIASCFKNDSTIGLISLASFSDNGLHFRDVRRIHASFIREVSNLASNSEYTWLNVIIYLYMAQKIGISWNFKNWPPGSALLSYWMLYFISKLLCQYHSITWKIH